MKSYIIFFTIILYFGASKLKAQNNINHESIQSVDVSYIQVDNAAGDSISFLVRAKTIIKFKPNTNINSLRIEFLNHENYTTISSIEYTLSQEKLTTEEGIVLFEHTTNGVAIITSNYFPLNTYLLKITTKDNQEHTSTEFQNTY